MAFDFLRKRKKYPANQAAKPPRPSEEPAAVYAGPPSGIRRHAPQADERGVSRRLYAGPPPMDDDSHPPLDVYAGPPSRDDDYDPRRSRMDPVYAGPPPRDDDYDLRRSRMDPVYAGPPPKDDEEDEETGEDGSGPVPSLIYAGPEDLT